MALPTPNQPADCHAPGLAHQATSMLLTNTLSQRISRIEGVWVGVQPPRATVVRQRNINLKWKSGSFNLT